MSSRVSTAVLVVAGGLVIAPAGLRAQTPNPTQTPRTSDDRRIDEQRRADERDDRRIIDRDVPVFRITVVGRTTPAINYRHRGGATSAAGPMDRRTRRRAETRFTCHSSTVSSRRSVDPKDELGHV